MCMGVKDVGSSTFSTLRGRYFWVSSHLFQLESGNKTINSIKFMEPYWNQSGSKLFGPPCEATAGENDFQVPEVGSVSSVVCSAADPAAWGDFLEASESFQGARPESRVPADFLKEKC